MATLVTLARALLAAGSHVAVDAGEEARVDDRTLADADRVPERDPPFPLDESRPY